MESIKRKDLIEKRIDSITSTIHKLKLKIKIDTKIKAEVKRSFNY